MKGFRIEYGSFILNAEDYEKRHEVLGWNDEKPSSKIITAVNNDLDIISEGVRPEFEILFYNLTENEYKNILALNNVIVIFKTDTDTTARVSSNIYDNMYCSIKAINLNELTGLPALQVKMKSTKAGALINGKLIENVCFMANTDYQVYDKTDEGKVIIYKG